MTSRFLIPILMLASGKLGARGAELPPAAAEFEGLWEVVHRRPRFPGVRPFANSPDGR